MAKGIVFQPQPASPIPGSDYGLWLSNTGDLVFSPTNSNPPVNISQALSGGLSTSKVGDSYLNDSGSVIPKLYPVSVKNTGGIKATAADVEAEALGCIGLAENAINIAASGSIVSYGRLANSGTSYAVADVVYLSKSGGITNIKPSVGVSGFVAGDWVVKVGVVAVNLTNPAAKDILVNVSVIGQL